MTCRCWRARLPPCHTGSQKTPAPAHMKTHNEAMNVQGLYHRTKHSSLTERRADIRQDFLWQVAVLTSAEKEHNVYIHYNAQANQLFTNGNLQLNTSKPNPETEKSILCPIS